MKTPLRAFTLVELMIVVAIIGILAAIAIPNFVEMQLRAKRSEAFPNVQGIKTSEAGYEASFDTYLPVATAPSVLPGKRMVDWTGNADFQSLGWAPTGGVRGQYSVTTSASDFVVRGEIDVDGDGNSAVYTATRSIGALQLTAENVY